MLIDWSQNTASKTTVAVYSVRALPQPSVSTPVTWDELDDALAAGDAAALRFDPGQVLDRVRRLGRSARRRCSRWRRSCRGWTGSRS